MFDVKPSPPTKIIDTGNGFEITCPCCTSVWNTDDDPLSIKRCIWCGRTIEVTMELMARPAPKPDREPKVFIAPAGQIPPEDFDPDYDALLRPYNQRDES